ncbi:MAG: beta-hydroxyacyl-ACP dehydratase [Desulfobacteraceae bacterium]|nr:beta-hydroxyacyl-ACP dehydratase [Desulfobacteraceae bacterium]MCF8094285.1 beta-hydroxyacyl-ACP dehydratase [Desulfobacteraceae bacterium]
MVSQIFDLIPQQRPFRFIDDILEVDENKITAVYRFREDEYFYEGHFPGHPVTPGVILIETMAQAGVVALGIGILLHQQKPVSEISTMKTLFTFAESIEFTGLVAPGEKVVISGEKIYFRRGSIKTRAGIARENGESVCTGVLMGTGVNLDV